MTKAFSSLVFVGVMAASAALAQDPGITDTAIKLGTQAPMSGVVAMIGMVAEGQKLRFDALNATGGVKMGDGKTRKVELVIMDDANEPPRTVTNARRMAEQMGVFAFVGSVGTPQNQAIKAYTAQRKIPNVFIYSGIYEWGDAEKNPWGIGMVPSFGFDLRVGDVAQAATRVGSVWVSPRCQLWSISVQPKWRLAQRPARRACCWFSLIAA
jgi:branched-chain amino acid transport system substrate-binding protein